MRKKSTNLWEKFKGKSNTKEVLAEKASLLAPVFIELAKGVCYSTLFKRLSKEKIIKPDKHRFWEAFSEMVFFCISVIDRFAFEYLGPTNKDLFMDHLANEVLEYMVNMYDNKEDTDRAYAGFSLVYNTKLAEYEKYKKLFPNNGEGTKDTLIWEFGKKIAYILGSENNIAVIAYTEVAASELILKLQLPELLSDT